MYDQKEKIYLLKHLINVKHYIDNTVSADPFLIYKKDIFNFNWSINEKDASKEQKIIGELFQVVGLPTYITRFLETSQKSV